MKNAAVKGASAAQQPTPVDGFSHCHAGILAGLRDFAELPGLQEAAQRARALADHTLRLLDSAVLEHHAEEEQELFTAVLRSAQAGEERDRVQAIVTKLTEEHREIEAVWKRLRPEVQHAAAGKSAHLRLDAVNLLVQAYSDHAQFEERELLPLAQEILGRNDNHMAALGLSLHMRHAAVPTAYI